MNKKFLISTLVVFVAWMAGSMLIHGVILGEAYMGLGAMVRTPEGQQATFPYMILAHVLLAGAFVWIYQRGREDKPWLAQGVRYGVAIALVGPVPTYLIYYAVQPWPGNLVAQQIVGDGILVIVLGVIVAALNKPAAAPAASNDDVAG